jgi:ABC-type lipoprotein export system ATPase subunit
MPTKTPPPNGTLKESPDNNGTFRKATYGSVARAVAARFEYTLPDAWGEFEAIDLGLLLQEPFRIGIVYGPSGSGKTQAIARIGDLTEPQWDQDKVVADHFVDAEIATRYMIAAGLASVPQMLKPYAMLSNGEQYRATLARRLAERKQEEVMCVDEFTSVVDRTVARSLCASLDSHLGSDARVVLATCHADVIEWLQPCWVINVSDGSLSRGGSKPAARWRMWTGAKIAELHCE